MTSTVKQNSIQTKIGKWLSLYTLLLFIGLPFFEVVNGFSDFEPFDFIELQENLEAEIEDISDKNEVIEKEYKILQTFINYNTKSTKTGIFSLTLLFSNYNSEVQVPPPEYYIF